MPYMRPSGVVGSVSMNALSRDRAAVREYQLILADLGYSVGSHGADGMLGADTSAAVLRFQQWYNARPESERGPRLTVDGFLGPATQLALQRYGNRDMSRGRVAVVAIDPIVPAPPAPLAPPVAPLGVPASQWSGVPVTPVNLPADEMRGATQRGYLNPTFNFNAPSTPSSPPPAAAFPWVAVSAGAGLLVAIVALLNYSDKKASR